MSQSQISSKEIQLKNYKGLYMTGYSRAAHRTGILIKGLDILLDAGLDVQKSFEHIFITHQHLDHVIYLPQYTMNIENENDTINIVSTENINKKVSEYLISALRMSKDIPISMSNEKILLDAKTKFNSITFEENYTFINGKEKWNVEIIKCYHGIESIGFGFNVNKIKLKEEYLTLDSKSIKDIKKSGIEITYIKEEPIFLYLGDTNKKVLLNEDIYKYPTIIIECTYLYEDEIKLAKINKHIHWLDIEEIIKTKNEIQFILIHFSMKYRKEEIETFFTNQNISNLYYLI